MAGVSPRDLRTQTVDDLTRKTKDIRQELLNLRFQKATGEIGNTARMKEAKKEIARLLTVLREKRNVS